MLIMHIGSSIEGTRHGPAFDGCLSSLGLEFTGTICINKYKSCFTSPPKIRQGTLGVSVFKIYLQNIVIMMMVERKGTSSTIKFRDTIS